MKEKIKAILIESGRVLNAPITGHWFTTPNFFKYIDKITFDAIPWELNRTYITGVKHLEYS